MLSVIGFDWGGWQTDSGADKRLVTDRVFAIRRRQFEVRLILR